MSGVALWRIASLLLFSRAIAFDPDETCTSRPAEVHNGRAARCLLQSQKAADFLLDTLPGQKQNQVTLLQKISPGRLLTASLGIKVKSGIITMLPAGSSLPAERKEILTSSKNQQTSGALPIMQNSTTEIAKTHLKDLPSLALYEHRAEIIMSVDVACNLKVYGNADMSDPNSESILLHSQELTICSAEPPPEPPLFTKKGVICMEKTGCDTKNMQPMVGSVSWLYNYNQRLRAVDPDSGQTSPQADDLLKMVNDNGLEFVPMIGWRYITLNDGQKCYFANRANIENIPDGTTGGVESIRDLADCSKTRCCEDSEIWDVFDQLFDEMKVRPKYLMAFNEPYATKVGMDHKNIPAKEAADYFRTVLQPIAERYNLQIVSTTSGPETGSADDPDDGISKNKMGHLADMIVACWGARGLDPPCKIDTMTKVSLHKYTCKGPFWEDQYGDTVVEGGFFNDKLKKMLKDREPANTEWDSYVDGLRYWVTETNCNWDGSKNNGLSPTAQCKRITGQGPVSYGEGSLKTMERLDLIERYLWWNLYNGRDRQMTQVARLTAIDGSLTPIGRAYTNGLSSETGCNRLDNTFKLARFQQAYVCEASSSETDLGKHAVDDNCLEACMAEAGDAESWCCEWGEYGGKCTFKSGELGTLTITSVDKNGKYAAIYPPLDFNSIEW